jgi:hypothetical protein
LCGIGVIIDFWVAADQRLPAPPPPDPPAPPPAPAARAAAAAPVAPKAQRRFFSGTRAASSKRQRQPSRKQRFSSKRRSSWQPTEPSYSKHKRNRLSGGRRRQPPGMPKKDSSLTGQLGCGRRVVEQRTNSHANSMLAFFCLFVVSS